MNQKPQWMTEIVVNAARKRVWEICEDITLIPRYHPVVDRVDLIAGQAKRSLGVQYRCNIVDGRRVGSCVEEVIACEPERMLATRMVSDTWGIDRMLADFWVESTLCHLSETSTIVRFKAFYEPVGLKNRVLNALFLRRALRKRSMAVLMGIKSIVEGESDGADGAGPTPDGKKLAL